ncbi:MAG: Zn-dependent hydrolase, partial [Gammaproteobacteria bacterium]|nr:Zn-dependent hydrolase [Gammaproteobacteria bacterium]
MQSLTMLLVFLFLLVSLTGCGSKEASEDRQHSGNGAGVTEHAVIPGSEDRFGIYASVPLTADLSSLSKSQRKMVSRLIDASKIMDELFWLQAYGEAGPFLASVPEGPARDFARINYGPWDRLNGDAEFLEGFGPKPAGARFYPADMTREEFAAADMDDKDGLYSLVRRRNDGSLYTVPYHMAYADQLAAAAELLVEASDLAEDIKFQDYLRLRAKALISDVYQPSDMAWLDMKNNEIDLVIGAIETYEDQLFNYRAGYEAYVLLKDLSWSEKLQRYAAFLPELQRALPVAAEYKAETPGSDSDLNAYDVIYYAGHSNA